MNPPRFRQVPPIRGFKRTPTIKIVGEDGSHKSILKRAITALRDSGHDESDIQQFLSEAKVRSDMSGDRSDLLMPIRSRFLIDDPDEDYNEEDEEDY